MHVVTRLTGAALSIGQQRQVAVGRLHQVVREEARSIRRYRCLFLGLLLGAASFAAATQDIVVGQVLSLSGPNATAAEELSRGRRACTDLINSQGGIRGRVLRLITRDDQGEPSIAVKAAPGVGRA